MTKHFPVDLFNGASISACPELVEGKQSPTIMNKLQIATPACGDLAMTRKNEIQYGCYIPL